MKKKEEVTGPNEKETGVLKRHLHGGMVIKRHFLFI
jgi:hypothetical protein